MKSENMKECPFFQGKDGEWKLCSPGCALWADGSAENDEGGCTFKSISCTLEEIRNALALVRSYMK